MTVDLVALRKVMGASTPPSVLSQEAFDGDRSHLHRLIALKPGEPATPGDLWDYTQDLRYTVIQRDLFTYLLPFCLQGWRDDLFGRRGYGGFVEHFYPVLADRNVFDAHLTSIQTAAVSDFMRQSILEEIDAQRGLAYSGTNARPYRWIRALTTYGVLLPDIELLWTAWWSLSSLGRSVAAVQYISALMYGDSANPVFAPWTRDDGGGPPCLWEFEGNLYAHRWQTQNVQFLQRTLSLPAVTSVLHRAVDVLTNEPEHEMASLLLEDLGERSETVKARCAELPTVLATIQKPEILLRWSI